MTAILEARCIKRRYPVGSGWFGAKREISAVDGVSFTLDAGRTLAVVGESGSGKSTLARIACLLEPPSDGAILIDGRATVAPSSTERKALRRTVQMVFQNPYGSLNPRKTIGEILQEPLTIHGIGNRKAAAKSMIERVGLRPEHYGRYPHMFSGGQRQRIAIARALMLTPRIVVADEPVSALDVSVQAQVLNLMMDLRDEFHLAYLFISHDLSVVRHMADEILVMYLGRPAEQGPKSSVFARPLHPYTQALLATTPSSDPRHKTARVEVKGEPPSPLDPPSGCAFHQRCPFATGHCAAVRPELRKVERHLVACHRAEAIQAGGF